MVFWILSGIAVWFIVGYIHAEAIFQFMSVTHESPTKALMDVGDEDIRRQIKNGEPVQRKIFSTFAVIWPLITVALIWGVLKSFM